MATTRVHRFFVLLFVAGVLSLQLQWAMPVGFVAVRSPSMLLPNGDSPHVGG